MRRIVTLLLLGSVLALQGCGDVFVGGILNPSTATGSVSIVRLTSSGDGTQMTFVTLIQNSTSQDFNFCGNVVDRFSVGSNVQVRFSPGTPCDSLISISIVF